MDTSPPASFSALFHAAYAAAFNRRLEALGLALDGSLPPAADDAQNERSAGPSPSVTPLTTPRLLQQGPDRAAADDDEYKRLCFLLRQHSHHDRGEDASSASPSSSSSATAAAAIAAAEGTPRWTLLHAAVSAKFTGGVRLLLSKARWCGMVAKINLAAGASSSASAGAAVDSGGAFAAAVPVRHRLLVEMLSAVDETGQSCLHAAAASGSVPITTALLDELAAASAAAAGAPLPRKGGGGSLLDAILSIRDSRGLSAADVAAGASKASLRQLLTPTQHAIADTSSSQPPSASVSAERSEEPAPAAGAARTMLGTTIGVGARAAVASGNGPSAITDARGSAPSPDPIFSPTRPEGVAVVTSGDNPTAAGSEQHGIEAPTGNRGPKATATAEAEAVVRPPLPVISILAKREGGASSAELLSTVGGAGEEAPIGDPDAFNERPPLSSSPPMGSTPESSPQPEPPLPIISTVGPPSPLVVEAPAPSDRRSTSTSKTTSTSTSKAGGGSAVVDQIMLLQSQMMTLVAKLQRGGGDGGGNDTDGAEAPQQRSSIAPALSTPLKRNTAATATESVSSPLPPATVTTPSKSLLLLRDTSPPPGGEDEGEDDDECHSGQIPSAAAAKVRRVSAREGDEVEGSTSQQLHLKVAALRLAVAEAEARGALVADFLEDRLVLGQSLSRIVAEAASAQMQSLVPTPPAGQPGGHQLSGRHHQQSDDADDDAKENTQPQGKEEDECEDAEKDPLGRSVLFVHGERHVAGIDLHLLVQWRGAAYKGKEEWVPASAVARHAVVEAYLEHQQQMIEADMAIRRGGLRWWGWQRTDGGGLRLLPCRRRWCWCWCEWRR